MNGEKRNSLLRSIPNAALRFCLLAVYVAKQEVLLDVVVKW